MAERTITPKTYVLVCFLLILLTFLTVGVSFLPLPGAWHLGLGLGIGLCKASLVVLIFMHVIHSPSLVRLVIAGACLWLCVLVTLTLTDYFTREQIPFMPGH